MFFPLTAEQAVSRIYRASTSLNFSATQKDTETPIHRAYGFPNKILITASYEQVQLIW